MQVSSRTVQGVWKQRHVLPAPEDCVLAREQHETLRNQIERLPPREQLVLRGRYGLEGAPQTLRTLGSAIGRSPERVRQLEYKGIRHLRRAMGLMRPWSRRAPPPAEQGPPPQDHAPQLWHALPAPQPIVQYQQARQMVPRDGAEAFWARYLDPSGPVLGRLNNSRRAG